MHIKKLIDHKTKSGKTWDKIASEIGLSYRGLRYVLKGEKMPSKAVVLLIDKLGE